MSNTDWAVAGMSFPREDEITVKTRVSGVRYRVTVRGRPLQFWLDADGHYVHVYTQNSVLGIWRLDRFGERLSPATIRIWITENVKCSEN